MSGRSAIDAVFRSLRPPPPTPTIDRLTRPPLSTFQQYRSAGQPVVLEGLLDEWPHRELWTLAGLRERYGDRQISAISTVDGRLNGDARAGLSFAAVRLADYVDQLEQGVPLDLYLSAPGASWMPELEETLSTPAYCRDASWRNSRFWMGPAGTHTPLHRDVAENIFFQLVGRKRFLIYPPAATPWLYSHPFRSALPNFSRYDPSDRDDPRFPLGRRVQPIEIVLGPGDAMFLPSRWWHDVRSLDISVSYNFWFADRWLAWVVRAAEYLKHRRKLEIYGLEARLGRESRPAGS